MPQLSISVANNAAQQLFQRKNSKQLDTKSQVDTSADLKHLLVNNSSLKITSPVKNANVSAYNDKMGQKKWMNKSNSVSSQPSFLPIKTEDYLQKNKMSADVTAIS